MCIRDSSKTIYGVERRQKLSVNYLEIKTCVILSCLFKLINLIHYIPVSYTHLDVYKRQAISCSDLLSSIALYNSPASHAEPSISPSLCFISSLLGLSLIHICYLVLNNLNTCTVTDNLTTCLKRLCLSYIKTDG